MWRDERRPVGSPRQNGELAESATSSGKWAIRPFCDLNRLLGVVDGDVDVHPEDELAPRDVLHLVDERAVAIFRRDPLALEERERMCARRADAQALLPRDVADVAADTEQLLPDARRRVADRRRDLEH